MNGFDLSTASEIYMGSSEISALYLGSELIWPSNYENEYFTITSLTNNNSISIEYVGTKYNIDYQFEVSTDKTNWTNYIFNPITETTKTLGLLNNGNRLYIRGNNQRLADNVFYANKHYICFKTTGSFKVSGNIMSLIDSTNYTELTSVNTYAFGYLFYNNGWLTDARYLYLPATTLANFCYAYMFHGCSSLTTAPALPATTLANFCYYFMFTGSHIITAPALPATTLTENCYEYMFNNCFALTTAPSLPATTLVYGCYHGMFAGCTRLTTAPELPATTLANNCYLSMFANCTLLTTAPELPATTLATNCYNQMFSNCSRLTTAPELPATTLASQCYYNMFYKCTSLITAPELPATTLANWCYRGMFSDCTSLSEITMLATDISADNCLTNWVSNVAGTGTFYKNSVMTTLPTGDNGIPTGWTVNDIYVKYSITISQTTNGTVTSNVQNAEAGDTITLTVTPDTGYSLDRLTVLDANSNPVTVTNNQFTMPASNVTVSATFALPYDQQYLTIESLENNNTIGWKSNDSNTKTIEWSTDMTNWTSATSSTAGTTLTTLNTGDKLYLKGTNNTYGATWSTYSYFTITDDVNIYGHMNSLLYGDNFINNKNSLPSGSCTFWFIFKGTPIIDASHVIFPNAVRNMAYRNIFEGCTKLLYAPELPNVCTYQAYNSMFKNCTSLTTAPTIKFSDPNMYGCESLFDGCTSLNSVTSYLTSTGTDGIRNWLRNVAATGTFTKLASMTSFPSGGSGIPVGWTVVDV